MFLPVVVFHRDNLALLFNTCCGYDRNRLADTSAGMNRACSLPALGKDPHKEALVGGDGLDTGKVI